MSTTTENNKEIPGSAESKENAVNTMNKENDKPRSKGEVLKQARLEKGISLETVHEATKVPMDALRAIEEGYNIRTLSPFYMRGFIKIYAKFLDVDLSPIEEKEKSKKKTEEPPPSEKQAPEEKKVSAKPAAGSFDLEKWLKKNLTEERKQQIVLGVGAVIVLVIVYNLVLFVAGLFRGEGNEPRARTQTSVSAPAASQTQEKSESAPQANSSESQAQTARAAREPEAQPRGQNFAQTSAPAQPAQVKDVTLAVRARERTWLRVKSDGRVVFQSTLRAGSVESWDADKEIELSGRNISQLEFEVNGEMIGTLGRKNRRAKKVIVSPDGLKVVE